MATKEQLEKLRLAINENLRVQRGGADPVPYIDVGSVLSDVRARQNHAIFARRGCGKTLLLHHSSRALDPSIKTVYLNCEDFKRHSFPNVLIEILDALFGELEGHLTGWFGKKKKSRALISSIRKDLEALRTRADTQEQNVRELVSRDQGASLAWIPTRLFRTNKTGPWPSYRSQVIRVREREHRYVETCTGEHVVTVTTRSLAVQALGGASSQRTRRYSVGGSALGRSWRRPLFIPMSLTMGFSWFQ